MSTKKRITQLVLVFPDLTSWIHLSSMHRPETCPSMLLFFACNAFLVLLASICLIMLCCCPYFLFDTLFKPLVLFVWFRAHSSLRSLPAWHHLLGLQTEQTHLPFCAFCEEIVLVCVLTHFPVTRQPRSSMTCNRCHTNAHQSSHDVWRVCS